MAKNVSQNDYGSLIPPGLLHPKKHSFAMASFKRSSCANVGCCDFGLSLQVLDGPLGAQTYRFMRCLNPPGRPGLHGLAIPKLVLPPDPTQMLHVWNIYLHLPQKWPSYVGKYSSTMEHLGKRLKTSGDFRMMASRIPGWDGLAVGDLAMASVIGGLHPNLQVKN